MTAVTLTSLNQLINDNNLGLVGTPAAVAYLNVLMMPPIAYMQQLKTADQMVAWIHRNMDVLHSEDDPALETLSLPELISWVIERLVVRIIEKAPNGYISNGEGVEYEDLTLTPWDIADAIYDDEVLEPIFEIEFREMRLPVDVIVNGHTFTHPMTMDVAMGILLFSQTANVNIRMSMYGAPLTYFIPGDSTRYDRYEGYATEGEFSIRMVGADVEHRHYFFGTDFLRGIKTGAEWAGVNHHDYWDSLRDDGNNPYTF